MAGKFPTAFHIAERIKHDVDRIRGPYYPAVRTTTIKHERVGSMDARRFEIKLGDGRVYAVHVNDITPEREKESV